MELMGLWMFLMINLIWAIKATTERLRDIEIKKAFSLMKLK